MVGRCVFGLASGIHSCRYSLRKIIGGSGCRRCVRRAQRRFLRSLNRGFKGVRRGKISKFMSQMRVRCGASLGDNSDCVSYLGTCGGKIGLMFRRSVCETSSGTLTAGKVIRSIVIRGKGLAHNRCFSRVLGEVRRA